MATSSITKNFVISGQKQVKMFADAIEASANNPTPPINVSATFLTDHIAPQFCHAQFYTVKSGALMPAGNCMAGSVFLL